jgi:nitrile hydratase
VLDTIITTYETNIGPLNGAKVIAGHDRSEYRRWLLDDGTAAIRQLGYIGVQTEHVVVVENTATSHHVAVCTLCSCYHGSWGLRRVGTGPASRPNCQGTTQRPLGDGPEPADDVEITVHDSSSSAVAGVAEASARHRGLSEEQLAPLITRDAMVGVAKIGTMILPMDIEGLAAPPRPTVTGVRRAWGELRLRDGCRPVRGRRVHWRDSGGAYRRTRGTRHIDPWCYYGQWLSALEDVLAVRAPYRTTTSLPPGHWRSGPVTITHSDDRQYGPSCDRCDRSDGWHRRHVAANFETGLPVRALVRRIDAIRSTAGHGNPCGPR